MAVFAIAKLLPKYTFTYVYNNNYKFPTATRPGHWKCLQWTPNSTTSITVTAHSDAKNGLRSAQFFCPFNILDRPRDIQTGGRYSIHSNCIIIISFHLSIGQRNGLNTPSVAVNRSMRWSFYPKLSLYHMIWYGWKKTPTPTVEQQLQRHPSIHLTCIIPPSIYVILIYNNIYSGHSLSNTQYSGTYHRVIHTFTSKF